MANTGGASSRVNNDVTPIRRGYRPSGQVILNERSSLSHKEWVTDGKPNDGGTATFFFFNFQSNFFFNFTICIFPYVL
jgi:hypothetical protein